MVRRQLALEATMKRFAKQPLRLGKSDCVKKVRFHLVKMGHRKLPSTGDYRGEKGAIEALKRQGVETVEQLLDKYLPRIAPAAMLPGDIALVAAEPGAPAWRAGTAVISVGRKFLGWHPDHPLLAILEPIVDRPFLAAWRA
jgi:hypothetical protein